MSPTIAHLKQQLSQLAELAASGALPDDAYQAAKAKLERQLLDAVLADPAAQARPSATSDASEATVAAAATRLPARLLWGMLAFVVALTAVGYAWVGHPEAWQVGPAGAMAAGSGPGDGNGAASTDGVGGPASPHALGNAQFTAMAESLAAKLKADPNNAEGWSMLARSYAVLGRFQEAVPAYQRASALRPDDAQLYADHADALAVTQGRQLVGEPAKLIDKALSLDPKNFKALSLAGTIAFDQNQFARAAELWDRALQSAPADNPDLTRQIRAALDDARQKAGLPALPPLATAGTAGGQAPMAPAAPPTQGAAAQAPSASAEAAVSGQVRLSAQAAGQVSPEDTVFIFARAAQGPKMPLAVVRKQVKDLPTRFTLTDAMAMSPQMKLSGFAEVVVGARVSKSGQAMPQAGDWQGLSQPVKLGASDVQIEIKDAVR